MNLSKKEMEGREKKLSSEESDLLQRSNKKFKRVECESSHTDPDASMVPNSCSFVGSLNQNVSYSQATRGFGEARNPLFVGEEGGDELDSDEDQGSDEDIGEDACPIIKLTREEKKRIRVHWKNSLIIKLFDKKNGI